MNIKTGNVNQFAVMAFSHKRNNVMIVIFLTMMGVINSVRLKLDLFVIQSVN